MTSQAPDGDVARLWQTQTDGGPMKLSDIRTHAAKFERQIHWRNLAEYGAAVIVVAGFSWILWNGPHVLVRIGAALILAGTVYVIYWLHARGSVSAMPENLALTTCQEFDRAQLLSQRDLLRSIWIWYLLPFVPGVLVLLIGRAAAEPSRAPRVAMAAIVCVLVFLGIGWLNGRVARKLDREIEALDAAR